MYTIVLALYVFVCILLIIAVLLQNSKSSDLGAAITTVIAAAFLVLSLILAIMSGLGNDSVMRKANILSQQLPAEATQAPVNMPAQGNSPVIPSNTPAE